MQVSGAALDMRPQYGKAASVLRRPPTTPGRETLCRSLRISASASTYLLRFTLGHTKMVQSQHSNQVPHYSYTYSFSLTTDILIPSLENSSGFYAWHTTTAGDLELVG